MSQTPEDVIGLTATFAILAAVILVGIAINLIVAFILYRAANVLDETQREVSPGGAFLLMVPLFGMVWIFIYTGGLSRSYQAALAPLGRVGDDCGAQLGMWWGITALGAFLPCVGGLSALASLVIMIIYLVRISECRSILLSGQGQYPPQSAAPSSPLRPAKPDDNNPYAY